jgi:hypothetical protein
VRASRFMSASKIVLPHDPCLMVGSSVVRILVEKATFWLNHHSCPTQTTYGTQMAGDARVTFPQDPL